MNTDTNGLCPSTISPAWRMSRFFFNLCLFVFICGFSFFNCRKVSHAHYTEPTFYTLLRGELDSVRPLAVPLLGGNLGVGL